MNFCIFDVITYSLLMVSNLIWSVVIWWIFVSLMWLHTVTNVAKQLLDGCDLMNFCIFDVITYSKIKKNIINHMLWFDEFLYLWCDYIQSIPDFAKSLSSCDLMNFCIFDVITYSGWYLITHTTMVVIWWIFVSLMWLHTVTVLKWA